MTTTVVDHPLVAARLTALRDRTTPAPIFRSALDDLATMLVYEACRGLGTRSRSVETPLATTTGTELAIMPLLIPILRAGLGLLGGAQRLLPDSEVAFVGLRRNEQTLQPDTYLDAVPDELGDRPLFVLDPMLATGGSLIHTLEILRARGATDITTICVLAAPEGIEAVDAAGFEDTRLVTAAIDERLNGIGYIVPGLGDAGDRQFGLLNP